MFILSRYFKCFRNSSLRVKYYQTCFFMLISFFVICNYNWFETAFKEVFIYSKSGQWCPRCSPRAFIDRRLINLTDQYILNKPHLCDNSVPDAFIMVISSAQSKSRRELIRSTWMKDAIGLGMKVAFALGSSVISKDSTDILMEDEVNQDIVQFNIIDDWRNLTLKTLASLTWFKNHCSKAKFFIKVDDDAVINVDNLADYLVTFRNSHAIVGHLLKSNSPCFAWWKQRHCMPAEVHHKLDYLDYYPPYPAGPMYVITRDAAIQLVDHSRLTSRKDFYFLEDVYLTLLAREIGIDLLDNQQFLFCSQLSERNFHKKIINAIVFYDCSAKQFQTIWSFIQLN